MYYEKQKIHWAIALIPIALSILFLYLTPQNESLPFFLILNFIVFIFLISIKMETRINEKGIQMTYTMFFFPIKKLIFCWDKKTIVSVEKYSPLRKFWGWGVRTNGKEWCYSIYGNRCIKVKSNNNVYYLGTQNDIPMVNGIIQKHINNNS